MHLLIRTDALCSQQPVCHSTRTLTPCIHGKQRVCLDRGFGKEVFYEYDSLHHKDC